MEKVELRNIGPICEVTFDVNKINVIIGPQSSGKSTIAKVVCFCQWMEKTIIQHQSKEHVTSDFVNIHLIEYHQFSNYINEETYIKYTSDIISFEYKGGEISLDLLLDISDAKLSKIAYIPSERNIITMPGIASLPLPLINLRSFIFDWLEIHSKFTEENPVSLLNLGINYHFDNTSKNDFVTLSDGKKIELKEASSGLQSVVPLYVYLKYYTEWIYNNQEDISFDNNSAVSEALTKELFRLGQLKEEISEESLKELVKLESARNQAKTLYARLRNLDLGVLQQDKDLFRLRLLEDNITKPHKSKMTLEEPEQNLFPETQVKLLYDILGMINNGRDNLFITTHSPYILYALNNSMLGYLVSNNIPDEIKSSMNIPFINPMDVSVWEIKDGRFYSASENGNGTIQDQKGLIRGNYFDRIMKNVMGQFSNLISYME